jgi:hypothetical protein
MKWQINFAAKRIRMIVIEPFEAENCTSGSLMWFTPHLEIFTAIDEPGDEVLFVFENGYFSATREIIGAHCRPYRHSTRAASQ